MESNTGRVIGAVVVLVIVAAGIAYFVLSPQSGSNVPGTKKFSTDASFIGVLAQEQGTAVGYIGKKDGSLTQLPLPPQGEELKEIARGGLSVSVLTEKTDGTQVIYQIFENQYAKRYTGEGVSGLVGSPENYFLGFMQDGHVFAVENPTQKVIDLGPGDAIEFFVYQGTNGVLIRDDGALSVRVLTDGTWGPSMSVKNVSNVGAFVTNGTDRFAYADNSVGQVVEMQISSISPFTAAQLNVANVSSVSDLVWREDGFYVLNVESDVGNAVMFSLQTPDTKMAYPVANVVPNVVGVFGLNP